MEHRPLPAEFTRVTLNTVLVRSGPSGPSVRALMYRTGIDA
jgi:hypothetical protein